MELRDLEYFGVIAEHLNLKRAALALGLSPAALSKCLRRLESATEARLVQRTGRGVELTPFGQGMAAQARKLRLTLDDITREASALSKGRSGHLRVGAGPTDCELLSTICARLTKVSPDVSIEVTISDNDELIPLIAQGKLDLAINALPSTPVAGIEQLKLFDDQYVPFASAGHPLAQRRRLELADLAGEGWVMSSGHYRPRELLLRVLGDAGLPAPRIALLTRSVRLRLQFVASSSLLGYGARMPVRMAMRPFDLIVLPVKELMLPRIVGVMYRAGGYLPPAAVHLIDLLSHARFPH